MSGVIFYFIIKRLYNKNPCFAVVKNILQYIKIFFNSSTTSPCSETNDIDVNDKKEEELEPVQFQKELDITDEDLQKYLEELEEEEEEKDEDSQQGNDNEINEKPNEIENETEVKPVRPGFLDLNEAAKSECLGSPGQTPLPKDVERAEVVFSETPR